MYNPLNRSCFIYIFPLWFKTSWLDLIPTLLDSIQILGWNTVKLLTGMPKTLRSLGSWTENFPLIQISSILSANFTSLWHKCQSVLMGQLHLSKACWEFWLSDEQPHSDYNGQWQRALFILAVLQSSQPNLQRNKKGKMNATNKLRSVQNTGTCYPGLGWICQVHLGSSHPGSSQTSLGLGSMSRYSAQILISIIKVWSVIKCCSKGGNTNTQRNNDKKSTQRNSDDKSAPRNKDKDNKNAQKKTMIRAYNEITIIRVHNEIKGCNNKPYFDQFSTHSAIRKNEK